MPQHFDGTPYIINQGTNWWPERMRDVVEYCTKNDPKKPDFLKEAIQEAKVRPYCQGKDAVEMTEEESKIVMEKQALYYKKNWHRALLTILRYRHPNVANADMYSLQTLV